MRDHEITLLSPADCSKEQLQQFYHLVVSGDQVELEGLAGRIGSAAVLAFAYSGGQLAGVASMKKQKRSYVTGVFLKAKVPRLAENYQFEMGYAVTKESFRRRGISDDLINALITEKPGTHFYATTKNGGMRDLLTKTGFIKTGSSWLNVSGETLELFILQKK